MSAARNKAVQTKSTSSKNAAQSEEVRAFDYQQLDDIIHSRIRLAVMSLLAAVESAEFTYLRDTIGATDGNISIHLKKLEEAEYIAVTKTFVDRKPVTMYTLNKKGRKAFELYVERLEQLVKQSTHSSIKGKK
ncbi:MAG: transcriptional regulator [Candidatus Kapaibacterium sp.]|nr:MAG: transcriptional regulator [Candidatus Kapabacteria bacterium]